MQQGAGDLCLGRGKVEASRRKSGGPPQVSWAGHCAWSRESPGGPELAGWNLGGSTAALRGASVPRDRHSNASALVSWRPGEEQVQLSLSPGFP